MIKIKSLILTSLFIFILSCGYKPLFQTKEVDFSITNIKFNGVKNLNLKIQNNLKKYINKKNKPIFYDIEINTEKRKTIISKDSKGNAKIFNLEVIVNFKLSENNILKKEKTFIENFKYNNTSKKFELSQYEKNIEENLINKILERINLLLLTL